MRATRKMRKRRASPAWPTILGVVAVVALLLLMFPGLRQAWISSQERSGKIRDRVAGEWIDIASINRTAGEDPRPVVASAPRGSRAALFGLRWQNAWAATRSEMRSLEALEQTLRRLTKDSAQRQIIQERRDAALAALIAHRIESENWRARTYKALGKPVADPIPDAEPATPGEREAGSG